MRALLLIASGCGGGHTEEAAVAGFSVVAEDIASGSLLSAWSDGDVLRMVGGRPGGDDGVMARWEDGALCVEEGVADRTLWWIHGARPGDWYAVGEGGRIVHETDGVRVREDVPTEATLFGVWAEEDGEAWAVGGTVDAEGTTGEIWRRTDGVWSAFATGLDGAVFKTWDGWFVGDHVAYRREGETMAEAGAQDQRLLTVRGRAADDVWAVGGTGSAVVRRWRGQAWEEVDAGALGQPLSGVWTAPGEDVYVAGNFGTAAILRDDGWEVPEVPVTDAHLHAVWGHGDDVFWVGGDLYGTGDGSGVILRHGMEREAATVERCALRVPGIGVAAASEVPARHALRLGDAAPAFTLLDVAGAAHSIADLRGHVVVVNFWASWCAPCLDELPRLDALHTRLSRLGGAVVAISVDREAGPAKGTARRLGLGMPVLLDATGRAAAAWQPPALPTTWLLGVDGAIRGVWTRALDDVALGEVETAARALLPTTSPAPSLP